MKEEKHDVIVEFTNGEIKRFCDCDMYAVDYDFKCFFICKGNDKILLPIKNVNFIAYADDISEML